MAACAFTWLIALMGDPAEAQVAGQSFVPVAPCRIVDTRSGGGPLVAGVIRAFHVVGSANNFVAQGGNAGGCGIPGYATGVPQVSAVMFNFIAVDAQGAGDLRAWRGDQSAPLASVLNYASVPGLNLANGIALPVSQDATEGNDLKVLADVSGTEVVIDVVGYFKRDSDHAHFGQLWQGSASIGLEVSNTTGTGVFGHSASSSPGVLGSSNEIGVYGYSNSTGVYGSGSTFGVDGAGGTLGVRGTGAYTGVYGQSSTGKGVHGYSGGGNVGVLGETYSGIGVRGDVVGSSGTAGGYFTHPSGSKVSLAIAQWAGYFTGSVAITGFLTKGAGSFRIDHPLDPENRYLSHSFVESPDMMNVYNGNAVLDRRGEAVIELPYWFEALNRDFRYQLTPLGVPQPALFVAEKVNGNRFRIGGGVPGAEVSWQVTGIRRDAYAEAHRIQVEEEKPEGERGLYLFPEGFGASKERSLPKRDSPGND